MEVVSAATVANCVTLVQVPEFLLETAHPAQRSSGLGKNGFSGFVSPEAEESKE
jgi:hypothetical protein